MSAAPGVERRRLIGLPLRGLRRRLRDGALVVLAGAAGLAVLGLALGQERARSTWGRSPGPWGDWHSFAAEGWFAPVVGALLVGLAALWARRGGLPRGMLVAALALGNTVALLACAISAHLFEDVDGDALMDAGLFAELLLFVVGGVLLVAEPLLFVLERRALEAHDPVFASARVVRDGSRDR